MSGLSNIGLADPVVGLNGIPDLSRGDIAPPSQEQFSEGGDAISRHVETWASPSDLQGAFDMVWIVQSPVIVTVTAVPLPSAAVLLLPALALMALWSRVKA